MIWSNCVDWVIFRFHFNFCWCHPKWGKVLTHFIDGWKFWNIRQRSAPSGQRRSDNGTGGERNWKYLEIKFIWRSKFLTLSRRSMLSFGLYTFFKKSVEIPKMSCRHVCSRVQSQFNFVSIFDSLGYNTISNSLKDNFMSFRCQIDSHNNFLISNFLG